MANRDLTTYRTVNQVVPEAPDNMLATAAAIGDKIIQVQQEAKINENFSKAQLELSALDNQFRIDYQGDPFNQKGLQNFAAQRQKVLNQYGSEISPFYKRQWEDAAAKIEAQSDATNQAWGFKQTEINTVQSVNSSMTADMTLAAQAGQSYAASGGTGGVEQYLKISESRARLEGFGNQYLGEVKTAEMLKNYDEDMTKIFLSNVSDVNPVEAARLLDSEEIKNAFSNPETYLDFKDAVNARALKVQDINAQKEVLGILKNENSLLAQSMERPISYAELQMEFSKGGLSATAQKYFLNANGFTKKSLDSGGKVKLSESEKVDIKGEIYNAVNKITTAEDVSSQDISALQDTIYTAMDRKVLTQAAGAGLLNQMAAPLIEKKENELKTFGSNTWFTDGIGFDGVQDYYENNVEIKKPKGGKKLDASTEALNATNKIKLYDYYMGALQGVANSQGVKVGELSDLPRGKRAQIYRAAQSEAQRAFVEDQYPALKTMPDTPNFIYDGGKLIPGATGTRNLNADVTAKPAFKTQIGSDGNLYRLYPNGKREMVGAAKGVTF